MHEDRWSYLDPRDAGGDAFPGAGPDGGRRVAGKRSRRRSGCTGPGSIRNGETGTVYWQLQAGAGTPAEDAWGQVEAYELGGAIDVERLHGAATGRVTSVTAGPNETGSDLTVWGMDIMQAGT